MQINDIKKEIEIIKKSPLRQYLSQMVGISLFEDERGLLEEVDKIVQINKDNLEQKLKLVVLGEVKAGKSTLVNALVHKEVSYTNVLEATANILEIKYSEKDEIVIKRRNKPDIILNSLEELNDIITPNANNQEFFSNISKITVSTNTERLKEITIVDTPGLNTVTLTNEERTENYIMNADVILWVLNAHHLGQSDVNEKIEEVLEYGKPIICVLNRVDEIGDNPQELIEYVDNEMGYMFSQVFAVSAKEAWEGYNKNNISKVKHSNIDTLYEYLVKSVERNADEVQMSAIIDSMSLQLKRDLSIHEKAMVRAKGILDKVDEDIKDLKQFNVEIREIINQKIANWMAREFFEEEKKVLSSCTSNDEFKKLASRYCDNAYVTQLINTKYESINRFISQQWGNATEKLVLKSDVEKLKVATTVDVYNFVHVEKQENTNIMEGAKEGGITAGMFGMGLAGYAAWLGPAAAYVSIGTAATAFVPPLLMAGVIAGGTWKIVTSNRNKINIYHQTDALVLEIKTTIKNKVLIDMNNKLLEASDYYYKCSEKMILDILSQCNISREKISEILSQLETYIIGLKDIVEKHDNRSNTKLNVKQLERHEEISCPVYAKQASELDGANDMNQDIKLDINIRGGVEDRNYSDGVNLNIVEASDSSCCLESILDEYTDTVVENSFNANKDEDSEKHHYEDYYNYTDEKLDDEDLI